ncbi:MAG: glycerol-3-phosphate 1-O-acyltransferase PlsY [Bacteroidetes bacterium]|nr:glycerol-3-phosphate 1-O-acyltransferase PlsY [Bacteroidota bacterium]MBU1114837.1 glycerol-3-phosphate 1-O-acyltransferase PlsY [Bacteroidota bacterium]MBU1799984.1 glycerol-3-phosphate 1-O-acyltransferase PlsY [Bacteroidota bacterium]
MLNLIVIVILSYLVGSIPTSIIVSKLVKGIDIRNHGSGNAGGSNVFRILGWKYGLAVIFLDALKGMIAVLLVSRLYFGSFPFPNATPFDDFTLVQIIAGIFAVLGHIWTIFAGFKGGKGIATGLGFLVSVVTIDMLLGLVVFTIVVGVSKYISLGSLSAAISVPLIMIIRENIFGVDIIGYHTILPFTIFLAFLVMYTHKANLERIFSGNESKISLSKKKK